jgi:O-methyltransferase
MDELVTKYPLISDQVSRQEVSIVLRELRQVLRKESSGDVVEFGCYEGTTSLFLARLLAMYPSRQLHVYDSFSGLPQKTTQDSSPAGMQFTTGALTASKKAFETAFKKAHLTLPKIHKGWFKDLKQEDIPEQICFAFLDGDYYESIKTSLALVWPRLMPGFCMVIDDYANEALPGAKRAVDEFISGKPLRLRVEASLAIVKPL